MSHLARSACRKRLIEDGVRPKYLLISVSLSEDVIVAERARLDGQYSTRLQACWGKPGHWPWPFPGSALFLVASVFLAMLGGNGRRVDESEDQNDNDAPRPNLSGP